MNRTAKPGKTRQQEWRDRERAKGRKRTEFWLTSEEREIVLALLQRLRDSQ